MKVWVGTSGYSYSDWLGGLYPAGTRPGRMLRHYCGHFPLVELNFTFYHPPTAEVLARMAEQTPEGFQFLVKLPRTLSHEEEPKDLPGFRQAVSELSRRNQLLGLLCQLPQATHDTPRHRGWLQTLASELTGYPMAVEFRHHTWFHPEVAPWLRERGLSLVSVDVPDLPGLYPRGLVQSSPTIYVRFHSRQAEKWYDDEKGRYDYSFNDEALGEWIEAIRRSESDKVLLLFNNCKRGQAAVNAQRMRELLAHMAPELKVVAPFAAPVQVSEQRLLFD